MTSNIERHNARLPAQRLDKKLQETFSQVFEDMGGAQRMQEWAEDNYTEFMRLYIRLAPKPQVEITANKLEIIVHPALKPSALDNVIEHEP